MVKGLLRFPFLWLLGGTVASAWLGPTRGWFLVLAIGAGWLAGYGRGRGVGLILVGFLLTWPAALWSQGEWARVSRLYGQPTCLQGIVEEALRSDHGRFRLTVRVLHGPAGGGWRVRTTAPVKFTAGDLIELSGALEPFPGPGNPGEFDYPAWAASRRLYGQITGKTELVRRGSPPLAVRLRQCLLATMEATLPAGGAPLLSGLLLGARSHLDAGLEAEFQRAGILHLLAVSGAHVAVVLGFIQLLWRYLGLGQRAACLASVGWLLGYAWLVGWRASVVRAVTVAVLVLAAWALRRHGNTVNTLAGAACLLLWVSPHQVREAGFQLSFAATLALLVASRLPFERLPTRWRGLVRAMGLSLGVTAGTFPVLAWHFTGFSLVAPVVNLLALPLAGLIIPLGITGTFVGLVLPRIGRMVNWLTGWLLRLLMALAAAGSLPSAAYLRWPPPPAWVIAAYYGCLVWLLVRPARRFQGAARLLPFILPLLLAGLALIRPSPHFRLTFIDVGQGDAILIESAGRRLLLDGGGGSSWPDPTERTVAALLRLGIRHLDYLVLTHPHADHQEGLEAVSAQLSVGGVILPAAFTGHPEVARWQTALSARGVPVHWASAGRALRLGQARLELLWPPPDPATSGMENEFSLVIRLTWREFSALLVGDLEATGEAALLASTRLGSVDLLKVGHHGARQATSQALLHGLQPRLAVISLGAGNRHGHPAPETILRLQQAGAAILRTDWHGMITIEASRRGLVVRTHKRAKGWIPIRPY